jgi:hypothetical protein
MDIDTNRASRTSPNCRACDSHLSATVLGAVVSHIDGDEGGRCNEVRIVEACVAKALTESEVGFHSMLLVPAVTD